jgi:hypothetical protein
MCVGLPLCDAPRTPVRHTPRHNACVKMHVLSHTQSRYSWDPLTTLVAVRGAAAGSTAECINCDGVNVIDPSNGFNKWQSGAKSNQTYVRSTVDSNCRR